jgi:choline dehydrogenase-like flavoprotein
LIIDFRNGAASNHVEADLCIIGAGAAGLSLAWAFLGSRRSVCLVEGGGFGGAESDQALYQGTSVGELEFDPAAGRMRAFGGTCNVWGGGCIPLDAMQARDWVPHSGWPLDYRELEPHYRRARSFLHIDEHEFSEDSFLTPPPRRPPAFDPRTLRNQLYASSPIVLGDAYRREFERAPNVQVLLHANLLELEAGPGADVVRRARIASIDGRVGAVHARHYVLACGGIENARLLLLSNSVAAAGLGNDRDLVGRYFMDHPSGRLGALVADSADRWARPYDRRLAHSSWHSHPEISLTEEAQRRHRVLSARVRPFPVESAVPGGIQALRALRGALQALRADETSALKQRLSLRHNGEPMFTRVADAPAGSIATHALRAALGGPDIFRAFARKLMAQPTVETARIDLIGYFEQAPNRDSRVTLGDQLDALGQRQVRVDWRLTELDRRTYRVAAGLFGAELARRCQGEFQIDPWLTQDNGAPPRVVGTAHHLGTTRMSDDPAGGVVDRDCRVHGIDNLYIAGSSVFPTGGWAFPTFAIVALTQRLAEHLRLRLAQRASEAA